MSSTNPGRILTAKFLKKATNKKDLVLRLRTILRCLREDESIEPDSNEYPGLAALCHALIPTVNHKDKEVRLYTVAACMELFTIYAPEAPWTEAETLDIFKQTIRQLANLGHSNSTSRSPNQTNAHFYQYFRILELLAEVKIAVLLVDLSKQNDLSDDTSSLESKSHTLGTKGNSKEALQVLAELFRTLLQSVRMDHPPDLLDYCQKTLTACVEEFFESTILPIPILDELLVCIGQGPKVLVLQQPQSSRKPKRGESLLYVQQNNPSYMVASAVVRASVDRLSTPIASLLNGLINSDPRSMGASTISNHEVEETNPQTAIPESILELSQNLGKAQKQQQEQTVNVYSVVLELQKVAPAILTTVIGTLSSHVETPDVSQRLLVVQTLGKLFAESTGESNLAHQYNPCFRRWLQRSGDKRIEIRKTMLPHLLALTLKNESSELAKDVQEALLQRLTQEPSAKFRTEVVQGLCTLSYQHKRVLSHKLILSLGDRVLSKDKAERKDALTGIVQLYFKQFLRHQLTDVLDGGDDCPIESVREVLVRCCCKDSCKPTRKRQRTSNERDQSDMDYYQWIPGVLFESASYSDATDSEMHSRVVQLVDELILGSSSPHPENRRHLTSTGRATGLVILVDAIKDNAKAWHWMEKLLGQRSKLQKTLGEYLEARNEIRTYKTGSEDYFASDSKAKDLLEAVASMIPPPSGVAPAQGERHALLEKFHSIKDKHVFRILSTIVTPTHSSKARARALDDLPKRVKNTGGDALSAWVKSLAKRCAMGDFINLDIVHHCVLLAQECYHEGDFEATHRFLSCVQLAVDAFPSLCAETQVFDNLTELFRESNVASTDSTSIGDGPSIVTVLSSILASVAPHKESSDMLEDDDLHKKLLKLCQNGTPEQAKHAVATIVSLWKGKNDEKACLSLLQSLATPSRLTMKGSSQKLVCVLAALNELADHCPGVFVSSSRGKKVLKFALETILMGRATVETDDDDSPRGRKKSFESGSHPFSDKNPLEDESLSIWCRTLCAAIELLCTFLRASIFDAKKSRTTLPSYTQDMIEDVFAVFSQILLEKGIPPSSQDLDVCGADRAALRQCAAINQFRLCDTRLGLDQKYLTIQRWHLLASSLLDEEPTVRKAVMEELGLMITGNGKFGTVLGMKAMAPRLRFVAMSVFCIDGSQGSHSRANGNAANIGKAIQYQKGNIGGCIAFLRKVYESTAAQCRAQGPEAEQRFEALTKLTVMPEYSIPYAFHLLAYRPETPSKGRGDAEAHEGGQRVLRKRLKALYDPLVLQLGASADNISFLLRMAEMLAKSFEPIGYECTESEDGRAHETLRSICATAREVLLSYVKTDANLDTHPGAIRMPGNLYRKGANRKRPAKRISNKDSQIIDMMIETESKIKEAQREMKTEPSNSVEQTETTALDHDRAETSRTRRSTRSSASRDESVSKASTSTDTVSIAAKKDHDVSRRILRRSTRSTRSSKFDFSESSDLSKTALASQDDESTDKRNETIESGQSPNNLTLTPDDSETPPSSIQRVGSNKKRRSETSQVSFAHSRVQFSPDVDFGGLSPIDRRSSRNSTSDKTLLNSNETRTRGSTPPSSVRKAKFTATSTVVQSSSRSTDTRGSESPTPVSDSTFNHSEVSNTSRDDGGRGPLAEKKLRTAEPRRKRSLRKFVVGDKENSSGATKKKEVPKQIKIVRTKPSPKVKVSKIVKKTRSSSRRAKKASSKPVDSFNFEG